MVSANDESRSRSCAPLRPLCLCGFNGPGYRGATGNTEAEEKEIIGQSSFDSYQFSFGDHGLHVRGFSISAWKVAPYLRARFAR